MSTIELLAVIFAVFVLVKMVVISINLKAWDNFWDPVFKHPAVMSALSLVLLAYTGWHVLQELTIVQVGAVFLSLMFLMWLSLFPYTKALRQWRKEAERFGIGRAWFPMVIWTAFALWILHSVFLA